MEIIELEKRLSPLRRQQEAYRRWQLARTVIIREVKTLYDTLPGEIKALLVAEMRARHELDELVNSGGLFHND